jgi:hypothetical protein
VTAVTHSLMIAVMLLHSICGCCWHHAHGECSDSHAVTDTAVASTSSAVCCHYDHQQASPQGGDDSNHDGEEPAAPHDHDDAPCEHGACVYVAGKSLELSQPFTLAPDCCFFFESVIESTSRVTSCIDSDATPHYESALAACARLQVWNI